MDQNLVPATIKSTRRIRKTVKNTAAPRKHKKATKNTTAPVEKIVISEKSTGRKVAEACGWIALGVGLAVGATYGYNKYQSRSNGI